MEITWRACSAADFSVSGDPAAAELLEHWTWFEMKSRRGESQWEKFIEYTLATIEAIAESLSGEGIAVWLSLFGPFLPDGVLGAAHLLVNWDDRCRFCMPPVESSAGTPGYVETGFSVEYRPKALRTLFQEHPGIPSRILPSNIRVSLFLVPEADFMEVGRGGRLGVVGLFGGPQLEDSERIVLEKATYLILPNLDFDFCLVGARKEQSTEIENLLRELTLSDAPADRNTDLKG